MRYLHTMVRVSDLEASLDFYCDKLGLVEVRRMENDKGRFTLVFLATPDDAKRIAAAGDTALAAESPVIELTYNWDEKGYVGGRNFGHLAYRVQDIYALCEKLMAAGVTINRPPRDGHMAFIRSPDGNFHRAAAGRPPAAPGALGLHAQHGKLVGAVNFGSDNAYGVLPQVMEALARANAGAAKPYGADALTAGLAAQFSNLFERTVAVLPVVTGTAANALALSVLAPPHGAIFCHAQSHIMVSECGAPEFYAHGAKLIGLEGADGKLTAQALATAIDALPRGFVHSVQPFAVSLSQPTELGTVYGLDELKAIAEACHARGLKLHLDGARFANALAFLGASPAQATWQCGVDVLSFGRQQGRHHGSGSGGVLRSRRCIGLRIPPQEGRPPGLEDALRLGPAGGLCPGRAVADGRRPRQWPGAGTGPGPSRPEQHPHRGAGRNQHGVRADAGGDGAAPARRRGALL